MSAGTSSNAQTITASAVALNGSGPCKSVAIYATSTNSGTVYVGGSTVTTSIGFPIAAGASIAIDTGDIDAIYVIGTLNDTIRWIATGVSV